MGKSTVKWLLLLLMITLLPVFSASGKTLKFAVVAKFQGVFFDQSGDGCREAAAALPEVECIYLAPKKGDVRIQDKMIEQLINDGIDGIAVAVTESGFLARNSMQKAIQSGTPVVTYDSDFDAPTRDKYKNLRRAYIGTNNFELGRAFGEQLKKLRPNGGKLIIQTGRPDSPNLNLRVMGIRSALSGKTYLTPPGEILKNDNGWSEVRLPIPNYDKIKRAVKQMESILKAHPNQADSFIAVGGWAQNDEYQYRRMIDPFKQKLAEKEMVVIISDASEGQLAMLRDHLAHGNVGQKPYEMGRLAISTLLKIVRKQPYEKMIYTPLSYCTPDNYAVCTH
ncbi:substrate-binding domain-containing protein [Psychromonas ossibalaenae]|uniref:substrate-binding domain-containing protein n=1 Tax=Psychromonas ossibalaenae TaxID=444922 RepID=UPI0003611652|nr:substrate-binding domain-containing protein [Psychromonas ossibalaenae]